MSRVKRIGLVAGEASGDMLGARLISLLRSRYPDARFEGVGGSAMQAAGFHGLYDMERLAVMGLIEPLRRLPDLWALRRALITHFRTHPPDLFIGIDAPDFTIGLETRLRQSGIKTLHYVSPSVWAWRQYRIRKIASAVDRMVTLFPFEADFYRHHGVPVYYAGHPLADQLPLQNDTLAARRALGLDPHVTYIALMAGSRHQELHHNAGSMLAAARLAWQQSPELQFVTAHANEARAQQFQACQQQIAPDLPLLHYQQRSHEVLAAADVVMVTSGTATLETLLFKKPMVIVYRMAGLTYQLAKWLVKTPYIGLPNLLANELVVPELIQDAATPQQICQHVMDFLTHPAKIKKVENTFLALHQLLRGNDNSQLLNLMEDLIMTSDMPIR